MNAQPPVVEYLVGFDPNAEEVRCRQLMRIEKHLTPPPMENVYEAEIRILISTGQLIMTAVGKLYARNLMSRN